MSYIALPGTISLQLMGRGQYFCRRHVKGIDNPIWVSADGQARTPACPFCFDEDMAWKKMEMTTAALATDIEVTKYTPKAEVVVMCEAKGGCQWPCKLFCCVCSKAVCMSHADETGTICLECAKEGE